MNNKIYYNKDLWLLKDEIDCWKLSQIGFSISFAKEIAGKTEDELREYLKKKDGKSNI